MRLGTWAYNSRDKAKGCLLELYHLYKAKYSAVITYSFTDLTSASGDVDDRRRRGRHADVDHHCEFSDQGEDTARELAENWIRSNLFDNWEPPLPLCHHCGHHLTGSTSGTCPQCGEKFRESA
jgi:hypothetical protein